MQGDKHALENEKAGIREELLRVEQEKMELETEKAGLNTTIEISENNIEQLKTEIQYLSKEKAEVTDQLNAVSSLCMKSEIAQISIGYECMNVLFQKSGAIKLADQ